MNLKSVKKESEIKLEGVAVDMERHDGQIAAVTLRDASGSAVVFKMESYCLRVLVPAPPPMVKRWRIEGNLKGLAFSELFENKYDADARVIELGADDVMVGEVEVPE